MIWPLITFPDLPERYDLDRGVTVAVRLFGVVPLWDHTIASFVGLMAALAALGCPSLRSAASTGMPTSP